MILNRFLARTEYSSYEDLYENFKLNIPEDFNFAYDVVDEYAKTEPKREALVWCDDNDESHIFTFKDLSIASQRTANFLVEKGIKKGDRVMLILRRRYEFWFFLLALHRIGAIAAPSAFRSGRKPSVRAAAKAAAADAFGQSAGSGDRGPAFAADPVSALPGKRRPGVAADAGRHGFSLLINPCRGMTPLHGFISVLPFFLRSRGGSSADWDCCGIQRATP